MCCGTTPHQSTGSHTAQCGCGCGTQILCAPCVPDKAEQLARLELAQARLNRSLKTVGEQIAQLKKGD